MNFPFIFQPIEVNEDMLSENLLAQAKKNNRKFPYKCMSLTYNAKNFIVATPLLKFYMGIGMRVNKVHWAMEYVPTKPFQKFVKEMVDIRIRSVGNNPSLGDRAKFTLNSCVGRFGHRVKHE